MKICDFGLSRAIGEEQPHLGQLPNTPRGEGQESLATKGGSCWKPRLHLCLAKQYVASFRCSQAQVLAERMASLTASRRLATSALPGTAIRLAEFNLVYPRTRGRIQRRVLRNSRHRIGLVWNGEVLRSTTTSLLSVNVRMLSIPSKARTSES